MDYRKARELASLRHELRKLLSLGQHEGAADLLSRFHSVADRDISLQNEYERWRLRFHLLRRAA
ncbi:MAG: hypothetical protein MJE77_43585 [Proteobacteria bacterium]|nr:hypothetical protein [Pseudomonadota bacterium]